MFRKRHKILSNNSILFFLFWISSFGVFGQKDSLYNMGGNSILMRPQTSAHTATQKAMQVMSTTALVLPFYDDFSAPGPYPNPNLYYFPNSKSVFVNHGFPIAPPSIGVATFDGLNAGGFPYCASCTTGSNNSDSLISKLIRLDSIPLILKLHLSDSIYFSFYYQAKGNGDAPETGDELMLYFRDAKQPWPVSPIWSQSGYNPNNYFPPDTAFRLVNISITDTLLLTSRFQFMFVNKSTQCGSIDHWHVDQIYMNNARSIRDTVFKDVSFVYDQHSLLKNYSQMPWTQFTGGPDMADSILAVFRNNDSTPINITTSYSLKNNTGTYAISPVTLGTNDVPDYKVGGYCYFSALNSAPLTYTYNGGAPFTDSTSFKLQYFLHLPVDTMRKNDTASFVQKFDNYFAYDDGTAERGYGAGSCAQCYQSLIAVKYILNKPDTLRSMDIYFDPVIDVNSLIGSNIQLWVWNDNGGIPGSALVADSTFSFPFPVYSTAGTDIYQRYQLTHPYIFSSPGVFYIGVYEQLNYSLNIGYDLNSDYHKNVFFQVNDGTGWHGSTYKGSLMMRPVFGDSLQALRISPVRVPTQSNKLYPNPANGYFYAGSSDVIKSAVISDLQGNVIMVIQNTGDKIDVQQLPPGMYLIQLVAPNGRSSVQKLAISR